MGLVLGKPKSLIVINHGFCYLSQTVNSLYFTFVIDHKQWILYIHCVYILGSLYPLRIILGCSTMRGDMLWVILHEPYEATCMLLPSWKLGLRLSLGFQGLIVGAFSTPSPMALTNNALASTICIYTIFIYNVYITMDFYSHGDSILSWIYKNVCISHKLSLTSLLSPSFKLQLHLTLSHNAFGALFPSHDLPKLC